MRTSVFTILCIEYRESKEKKNDGVISVFDNGGDEEGGYGTEGGALTQPSDSEATVTDGRHITGY